MEVCGTHTMAIASSGIKSLLPPHVELISGPGCPVCVTTQSDIDRAMMVARQPNVIFTTFGDMIRVPGSQGSLEDLRRSRYDIRIVYSCMDALHIARHNPQKNIVFMGVGFETTAPTVAETILEAQKQRIDNFFVLANFKLVIPALDQIAKSKKLKISGFICPGHVSVITGSVPYQKFAKRYKKPCVIMGFERIDLLKGITRLMIQVQRGQHKVEIEYQRAVQKEGNKKAQNVLDQVFQVTDVSWRGLGKIKSSGLKLRKKYEKFSAEKRFPVKVPKSRLIPGCICGDVLQGLKYPKECQLFRRVCTPQNPIGPCMVSSEGSCAAAYQYEGWTGEALS